MGKRLLKAGCNRTKDMSGEMEIRGLRGLWVCTKRWSPQGADVGWEERFL